MDKRLGSIIAHHRAARNEMEAADAELEAMVAGATAPEGPEPPTYPKSTARGEQFEKTARLLIERAGACALIGCRGCPFSLRESCADSGFSSNYIDTCLPDPLIVASARRYLAEVAEEREHLKAMVKVTEALK